MRAPAATAGRPDEAPQESHPARRKHGLPGNRPAQEAQPKLPALHQHAGRRYVDLLPPRHPKRTTCPTASWTCRRSRSALFHYAFNPIDERVVAYRPIRNTYMTLRKAAWSGLKPMPDILRYVPSRAAPVLLLPSKTF